MAPRAAVHLDLKAIFHRTHDIAWPGLFRAEGGGRGSRGEAGLALGRLEGKGT